MDIHVWFRESITLDPVLFWFGCICWATALATGIACLYSQKEVAGANAMVKPFKFFLSSAVFAWTMEWLLLYLPGRKGSDAYSWGLALILVFETIYILLKAIRGEKSHFNISTPLNAALYGIMGIAITVLIVWTACVASGFFLMPANNSPVVWGIRFGIVSFVAFALQGWAMGARMSHTVGGPDGGEGIPLLNWNKRKGDLRVAHFFGMHGLQSIPLFARFIAPNDVWAIVFGTIWILFSGYTFLNALKGKPLFGNG